MHARAIETPYDGWIFRSRTEARWAVFWNALGLRYEYEPEGFELASYRYLPDFWLPDIRIWVEVKPDYPSLGGKKKANLLSRATDRPVLVVCGMPWDEQGYVAYAPKGVFWSDWGGTDQGFVDKAAFRVCAHCHGIVLAKDGLIEHSPCKCPIEQKRGGHPFGDYERIQSAYARVRSERFGENLIEAQEGGWHPLTIAAERERWGKKQAPARDGMNVPSAGRQCEHPRFGHGIVERVVVVADDSDVTIRFDDGRVRTLSYNFARITLLPD